MTGHAKLLQETFSSYQDKFAFCVVSTIFTPTFLFNYNMINPLHIINQLFEMQAKMKEKGIATDFERNFNRLFNIFDEDGYMVQDPTGESYSETRTDCEASITGRIGSKMKITRTIKPIIYQRKDGSMLLLQKGVVIAENK
jgi:hypothetical protein